MLEPPGLRSCQTVPSKIPQDYFKWNTSDLYKEPIRVFQTLFLVNTLIYFGLGSPVDRVAATASLLSTTCFNFLISQTSSASVANPCITSPSFPNKDSNHMTSTPLPHIAFQKRWTSTHWVGMYLPTICIEKAISHLGWNRTPFLLKSITVDEDYIK